MSTPTDEQDPTDPPGLAPVRGASLVLLATVFVVATCGLVYELLAGTLSTYLLGSSVTQFSLVIGMFLTAMGIGSFLSKYCTKHLLRTFFIVELTVGLVGGLSSLALFAAFAVLQSYVPLLVMVCLVLGTLVGLEIPLLVRIFRRHTTLKAALGNVLALDYLGALVASLLFPLVLLPVYSIPVLSTRLKRMTRWHRLKIVWTSLNLRWKTYKVL